MDQFLCASLSHTHYWYEVRPQGKLAIDDSKLAIDDRCDCIVVVATFYACYWPLFPKVRPGVVKISDIFNLRC